MITVIVNGSARPASLSGCIDSLLNQKRINWIAEIVVLGSTQIPVKKGLSLVRACDDFTAAILSLKTPWVAFIAADGVASQDWLEKLFQGLQRAQTRSPLIAAAGGATRLVDIGGFSQSLNILLDSPFAHIHCPLWWRPDAATQADYLSFKNSIYVTANLQQTLAGIPSEPWISLAARTGLHLKENGSLAILMPEPVIMRRELAVPSVWLGIWRDMGRAQEHLDREVLPSWTVPTLMAYAIGGMTVLSLIAMPFNTWFSSILWLYVLLMLNASAYAAFKVHEGRRLLGVFGWMIVSQMNFTFMYWGSRLNFWQIKFRQAKLTKLAMSASIRYRGAAAFQAKRLWRLAHRHSSKLLEEYSQSPPHSEPGPRQLSKTHPIEGSSPHVKNSSMRFDIQSRPESAHLFAVGPDIPVPPSPRKQDSTGASSALATPPSPPPA